MPLDNNTALVHVMSWWWSDKPLPEPMLPQSIFVAQGGDELIAIHNVGWHHINQLPFAKQPITSGKIWPGMKLFRFLPDFRYFASGRYLKSNKNLTQINQISYFHIICTFSGNCGCAYCHFCIMSLWGLHILRNHYAFRVSNTPLRVVAKSTTPNNFQKSASLGLTHWRRVTHMCQ